MIDEFDEEGSMNELLEEAGLGDDFFKDLGDESEDSPEVETSAEEPQEESGDSSSEALSDASELQSEGETEEIEPQPEYVSREEFDALQRSRDGILNDLQSTRQQLAQLKPVEPQVEEPPVPPEDETELEKMVREHGEMREQVAAMEQREKDRLQFEQDRRVLTQAAEYRLRSEEAIEERIPTYRDDISSAQQTAKQFLMQERNLSSQQADVVLQVERAKIDLYCAQNGLDAAEFTHRLAVQQGWIQAREEAESEAGPPEDVDEWEEPKAPRRRARKKPTSLSEVGGSQPSGSAPNPMDSMSDKELAELADDPEALERLMMA